MYGGREALKDKELLKLLKRNGWKVKRIQGSHHILEKNNQIEVRGCFGSWERCSYRALTENYEADRF